MTTALYTDVPRLPFPDRTVLDIAPHYRVLRERAPIVPVRTLVDDPAWLPTRYHLIKQLFMDERLGRSHHDPLGAPRLSTSRMFGGPIGDYATEKDLHRLHRSLLTPAFSARRVHDMEAHIKQLVRDALDRLEPLGPIVDLKRELSLPVPVVAVCELLGVPVPDQDELAQWSERFASLVDERTAMSAGIQMLEYMRRLVVAKRVDPGDDVMSDLVAAAADNPLLTDTELATNAVNLFFGGHETTASRLAYGILLLLLDPEQRRAMMADPELVGGAVEEVLRFASPVEDFFPRYARVDLEVEGVTIRRGEVVLLSTSVANRDDSVFPDPDRFDIRRRPAHPHLTFGHGARFCVGAAMARMELEIVFVELFRRFPDIELAVPLDELRRCDDLFHGGLERLPVRLGAPSDEYPR